jgi:MFS family permease
MADITAGRIGAAPVVSGAEQRKVIVASSVGTVFEWYDFYLYAVLAPFFAGLFFPPGNQTAALLSSFATYAAGFLVRPFGAIIFGRVGDLVGRKYTFLITIVIMGSATFLTGLLPTFAQVGYLAPFLLVLLRLLQGLALGGEYGGAATYVAEHAETHRRGYATSWIQTTATLGLLLALIVIGFCRYYLPGTSIDAQYGWWRIPFLASLVLLVFSVYIRLKLNESPVFTKMVEEGRGSKSPLADSFFKWPNNGYVLLALLGATAGQGVVWYAGQFYAIFFMGLYLKLDYISIYWMEGLAVLIATPFFIVFGALSDKIGRKPIILLGCLIAVLTYYPAAYLQYIPNGEKYNFPGLFESLSRSINPALTDFNANNQIVLKTDKATCGFHIFPTPFTKYSQCDKARDALTKAGINFTTVQAEAGQPSSVTVGSGTPIAAGSADMWQWSDADDKAITAGLAAAGYPAKIDYARIDYVKAMIILIVMVILVTMVYGPIAAFLVELFPTRIRYTSMSLPYHIGNGWFGGMLPLLATAMVAASGNIYAGLLYPIWVAAMTFVIGTLLLRDNINRPIHE